MSDFARLMEIALAGDVNEARKVMGMVDQPPPLTPDQMPPAAPAPAPAPAPKTTTATTSKTS